MGKPWVSAFRLRIAKSRDTPSYSRIQTLSGFANGIFLILISIFIIVEGLQRM